MHFSSWQYPLFFVLTWIVYLRAPYRFRRGVLLVASYVFYAWDRPADAPLIALATLFSYALGVKLRSARRGRRVILWVGIGTLTATLVVFKVLDGTLHWTLPIGLSFFTFQMIAYLVDVYHRRTPAEEDFSTYALFIAIFPKVLAGPIERAEQLIPQLREKDRFDYHRSVDGLLLVFSGVFKKFVIAAGLLPLVVAVQSDPRRFSGLPLVLACVATRYVLYCDFSGYTDIARGSAAILGFDLSENFRRPFFARSILDFWRRWHMTLCAWFRDYLFLPLSRVLPGRFRVPLAVVIVFYAASLWHGTTGGYLLWATLQVAAIGFGRATRNTREELARRVGFDAMPQVHCVVQIVVTFAILTLIDISVQAPTVGDAVYVWTHLASRSGGWWHWAELSKLLELGGAWGARPAIGFVVVMEVLHAVQARAPIRRRLRALPAAVRWPIYVVAVLCLVLFAQPQAGRTYYYFQF